MYCEVYTSALSAVATAIASAPIYITSLSTWKYMLGITCTRVCPNAGHSLSLSSILPPMALSFKGQIVVVTGAGGGLGRASVFSLIILLFVIQMSLQVLFALWFPRRKCRSE